MEGTANAAGTDAEGASPPISVVVASWSGEERTTACLDSLLPQAGPAEVIVVTNGVPEQTAALEGRFPGVRFIQAPQDATVFRMRSMGADAARGALIALLEDHATVSPQWMESLVEAHQAGHLIVGGPVGNGATERLVDWALYFSEYGYHMPPIPEGHVATLSGVNIAYDRAALEGCRDVWEDTLQENEVNDAIAPVGGRPYLVPDAWVLTHLPMTLSQAMVHLFGGGRHFARYRAARSTPLRRVAWMLASPAVPFVLMGRISARTAARSPSHLRQLAGSAAYLAMVLGSWSVGEALGYLEGLSGGGEAGIST